MSKRNSRSMCKTQNTAYPSISLAFRQSTSLIFSSAKSSILVASTNAPAQLHQRSHLDWNFDDVHNLASDVECVHWGGVGINRCLPFVAGRRNYPLVCDLVDAFPPTLTPPGIIGTLAESNIEDCC